MSGKERSVLRICLQITINGYNHFQFIKRLRENNIGTGAFQNGNARPTRRDGREKETYSVLPMPWAKRTSPVIIKSCSPFLFT